MTKHWFKPFSLVSKGRLFTAEQPVIMGIINATPDSFHEHSRVSIDNAIEQAARMIEIGAEILDIGGQSTRPGATEVSANIEAERVIPVIEAIRSRFPDIWLSVDTYFADVAQAAIGAGADIINDISAGDDDIKMLETVAELNVPYIAMHKKGKAATMQNSPEYENVVHDVVQYFMQKNQLYQNAGIHDWIIDPGFGFGKNDHHNFSLVKHFSSLAIFGKPILAGVSRKGMIQRTLGVNTENALNGTTALHMYLLEKGASILRVHDVLEAKQSVQLFNAIQNAN